MRTFSIVVLVAAAVLATASCGDTGSGNGSIVGTWAPDAEAFRPEIEKMAMAQLEPMRQGMEDEAFEEFKKNMLDGMLKEFEGMGDARLVIKSDDTFLMYDKEGEEPVGKGTVAVEDGKVTLTPTEQRGKPVENPDVMKATFEGGVIRVKMNPQMPEMVFRRK